VNIPRVVSNNAPFVHVPIALYSISRGGYLALAPIVVGTDLVLRRTESEQIQSLDPGSVLPNHFIVSTSDPAYNTFPWPQII